MQRFPSVLALAQESLNSEKSYTYLHCNHLPDTMLHPLFSTLIQRPDLALDHASAYAALIDQEARATGSQLLRRGLAWALVGVFGCVCIIFTGVALMLGFLHNQFHWILVAVPGAALLMTVAAIVKAQRLLPLENFMELKAQIDSDARALRMVA
jgi:hypothetical protein